MGAGGGLSGEDFDLQYHWLVFENQCLKLDGASFQGFFEDVMGQEIDKVNAAKKAVEEWRGAAERQRGSAGFVPEYATEGSLDATRIILERRISETAEQLSSFKVHPQYGDAENEASRITRDIHELVTLNVSDREMVEFYREATTTEQPADPAFVEELYREAGIYLGERVVKRLEDVQEFHTRVVENRRAFLSGEITRLERVIGQRESNIEQLTERRSVTLRFLREHGALEEFVELQERHNADRDLLAGVRAQLDQLRGFEEHSARLRIERDQLVLDARSDFETRRADLTRAVEPFSEVGRPSLRQPRAGPSG